MKLDKDKDGIACEVIVRAASPTPLNTEANKYAEPLSTCQLKETQNIAGAGAKGFPARPKGVPATGNVKIAIIPIDFSNAVGTGNPIELFSDDIAEMRKWAPFFSRGRLTYEIQMKATSWIRAPKGADWYTCTQCGKGSKQDKQDSSLGLQQLIDAADPIYDFTGANYLYFVFPEQAESEFGSAVYGDFRQLNSSEGPLSVSVYGEMGGSQRVQHDRSIIWDHAVHEILHSQGFIGHGPSNGTGYITTNQWGSSKAVTSWEGFLNGWFGEDEIFCLDKAKLPKSLEISMESLDTFGPEKESVMIRLNDSELIVIEQREAGPYTVIQEVGFQTQKAGMSAYRVNVNSAHYRDDKNPTADRKNFWSLLNNIGHNFTYEGVSVTPLANKKIRISITQ